MKINRKQRMAWIGIGIIACLIMILLCVRVPVLRSESGRKRSVLGKKQDRQSDFQKMIVMVRPIREKAAKPIQQVEETVKGQVSSPAKGGINVELAPPEAGCQVSSDSKTPNSEFLPAEVIPQETNAGRAPHPTFRIPRSALHTPVSYPGPRQEIGKQLLGIDGKRKGTVPLITMDYRRNLGWPGYVRAMRKLGGLFFIYDNKSERIRALVDVPNGEIRVVDKNSLCGMSPRVREIRKEIAASSLMEKAEEILGQGDYSLILLLPLRIDFDIVGGMAKGLADHGIDIRSVGRVIGEHELYGRGVRLHVKQVVYRTGEASPMSFVIEIYPDYATSSLASYNLSRKEHFFSFRLF